MPETDRGIHPDLVGEQPPSPPPAPPDGHTGRGRSRRPPTPPAAAEPSPSEGGTESGEATITGTSPDSGEAEAPDWRTADSDEEAFRLLAKKLPSDVLAKDETLSGYIGSRADIRARDILRQQQRDADEARKREAAANNDLYTLGEITQREYQQQLQQGDQAAQLQPLMEVITRFQQTLPESVQRDVAGKAFGEGRPWGEGLQEYLSYLVDSATKLRLSERESALRKSILSEINGTEPVPEREGGTPSRVRVVTDEQIAAMSLAEYEALFDENGRPRQGVQHRATRGIPIQRQ